MTSIALNASRPVSSKAGWLVATSDSPALTVLRLALGVVMFPHGAQKLLGWWGGYGLDATLGWFGSAGIPAVLGILAIAAEFAGGIALVAGVGTRIAAFGIAVTMAVAALLVHLPYGFFMNWSGAQKGEGIEYHILAFAMAVALMIAGGGRWSVDRAVGDHMGR